MIKRIKQELKRRKEPGRVVIILITVGCIFFLLSPLYILTRPSIYNYFGLGAVTGTIGDTVGGLTAPIINIIGSVLIFVSFLSQNKANKIQAQQNSFDFLRSLYNDIKKDYEAITFIYIKEGEGSKELRGRRAISMFIKVAPVRLAKPNFKNNSFFYEYLFVIGSISILLDRIDLAGIELNDKKQLLQMLHFFYETRMKEQSQEIFDAIKGNEEIKKFTEVLKEFQNKMENNFLSNFQ